MLREKISRYQRLFGILAVAVIGLVGIYIIVDVHTRSAPYLVNCYFSRDDGSTYFAGESSHASEYANQSPPAYRAIVCQCDNGTPFVAFLVRTSVAMQQKLDKLTSQLHEMLKQLPQSDERCLRVAEQLRQVQSSLEASTEVKRPGAAAHWSKAGTAQGIDIEKNIRCPLGQSGTPRVLLP